MLLLCMKEKNTPYSSMGRQSSAESDDQIPPQPLQLKKPHQPKGKDDTHTQTPSASKLHLFNNMGIALQELVVPPSLDVTEGTVVEAEDSGRERLKRHRVEVAGRVWIPDIWGQEELLKDWIDCTAFDTPLVPSKIVTARTALVEEGRRASTGGFGIQYRC